MVEDHARLDARHPPAGIDFEDAVQVLGHVHHDGFTDGLTGQTRPPAPGKNRNIEVASYLHGGENIFVSARNDDTDGFDLVNARIRAVKEAGDFVESDFAGDPFF